MKIRIFLLGSSFGKVQDQSKYHLDRMSRTFILNLFKICAGRPEGLVPLQLCHTPSLMDIDRSTLEVIFTHPSSHILSPHLTGSIITWSLFFSTRGKQSKRNLCFQPRVFSEELTSVDFGQHMVKLTQICPRISIFAVRIYWHENKGWTLTLTGLC